MNQLKNVKVQLDYAKPNLINYCLTSGIVAVLLITNLAAKQYEPCIALIIAQIISSILFWIKKIPQIIKSFLLPMSPATLNFILILYDKATPTILQLCYAACASVENQNNHLAHIAKDMLLLKEQSGELSDKMKVSI